MANMHGLVFEYFLQQAKQRNLEITSRPPDTDENGILCAYDINGSNASLWISQRAKIEVEQPSELQSILNRASPPGVTRLIKEGSVYLDIVETIIGFDEHSPVMIDYVMELDEKGILKTSADATDKMEGPYTRIIPDLLDRCL